MGPYTDAIITGLAIALASTLIIFTLLIKYLKDQRKWERLAEENYLLGRDEASQVLRETWDRIAQNREGWQDRTEKELLTELLVTLDNQSRRLDRMEDKLKTLSHYKSHIADMKGKTQQLTQSYLLLEQQTTSASAAIGGLQQTIGETGSQIDGLVSELSGMGRLHQTVGSYAAQLGGLEQTLKDLQGKTLRIVEDMDTVIAAYDKTPVKRMKDIEMEITGLSLLVKAIGDSVAELSEAREPQLSLSDLSGALAPLSERLDLLHRELARQEQD